jgi:UDP-glucose 4-epimerase
LKKKKVIVTGGAGFIGSHVAEMFTSAGHEVLALDDLSRGKKENLPENIRLEKTDIRDREAVDKIFLDFKPEAVCHQAAQVSVRESVYDPRNDAGINVMGGLNILEACKKYEVEKFLFASTGGAIYGEQDIFPAPEAHPERPLSPYAIAKLAVEKYLFFYEKTYGLKWTALRYSNVYGPRQDPHGEAGVVAIFCQKMYAGTQAVINGDGGQTRDFVYAKDVARANLFALENEVEGPVNIATGIETDVNDIFRILLTHTGSKMEEQHGPAMPGEQRRSVLDPSLAQKVMGWKPEVSLEDGLKETALYFNPDK